MSGGRFLRLLSVAVCAGCAALVAPAPAQAHPFGDPQTADVTSTATGVRVHWSAASDDVTMLGIRLGAIEATRTFVFKDGALVPEESDDTDGVALATAPGFVDYLTEHIDVAVTGAECVAQVLPVDDVVLEGATVEFDCGRPVTSADVTITMLTDIHEAYRTMASGPHDQLKSYSTDAPTFTWTFGEKAAAGQGDSAGQSALLQIGGVAAGVALIGVGAVFVRRRVMR